jgi:hypothetical protein
LLVMAPSSQELEPPANPARFKSSFLRLMSFRPDGYPPREIRG